MLIDKNTIEKIRKIMPYTSYGELETDEGFLVPIEYINNMLDDLIFKIRELDRDFEEWKKYVDDNYKKIPYTEQICVSESDFH